MSLTETARGVQRVDLAKPIGTELRGVKLTQLDDREIAELTTLVAERGVLFFRDQEMSLDDQVALGPSPG